MAWTKESAIREMESLIKEAQNVANYDKASPEFSRWYLNVSIFLEEIFGGSSKIVLSFRKLRFYPSGSFVIQSFDIQGALNERNHGAFIDDLNLSIGIIQAGIDELSRKSLSEVYQGKNTPRESSMLIRVLSLAEYKIRKTIRDIPANEKEIQDAFENLLIGADIPYKREHPHITYSSKEYIPDFSFERIDLALEVKFCARKDREKKIIAEMNDDIMAYKTKFGNIAFLIYDVGKIRLIGLCYQWPSRSMSAHTPFPILLR